MYFENRTDAGRQLGHALARYRGSPGVVFPLPRGGVTLGVEVARILGMPIDLVIPRKIGHPLNPEYAICAVTEAGELVCNAWEKAHVGSEWLKAAVAEQREVARIRRERYLSGKEPMPLAGKTAIIVDDGIATGLTMQAAILDVKSRHPARIVVAIPVAPADSAAKLAGSVDDVVGLEISHDFLGSVGAYYRDFEQVSDDEVIAMLRAMDPH